MFSSHNDSGFAKFLKLNNWLFCCRHISAPPGNMWRKTCAKRLGLIYKERSVYVWLLGGNILRHFYSIGGYILLYSQPMWNKLAQKFKYSVKSKSQWYLLGVFYVLIQQRLNKTILGGLHGVSLAPTTAGSSLRTYQPPSA